MTTDTWAFLLAQGFVGILAVIIGYMPPSKRSRLARAGRALAFGCTVVVASMAGDVTRTWLKREPTVVNFIALVVEVGAIVWWVKRCPFGEWIKTPTPLRVVLARTLPVAYFGILPGGLWTDFWARFDPVITALAHGALFGVLFTSLFFAQRDIKRRLNEDDAHSAAYKRGYMDGMRPRRVRSEAPS